MTREAGGRITAAVLAVPWLCLVAVGLLAIFAGVDALDEAHRADFARLLARVGPGQLDRPVEAYVRQVEPYLAAVVPALAGTGLLLLLLHRSHRATCSAALAGWKPFERVGVSAPAGAAIVGVGLLVVVGHHLLVLVGGWRVSTSLTFPIGIFFPGFHASAWPYALAFLAVVAWGWSRARGGIALAWILGLVLLLLGNLLQGGWFTGFRLPVEGSGIQYFHAAIRIEDVSAWLASFTSIQGELHPHSGVHPPFAVLLHYYLWRLGGVTLLSLAFTIAASSSVPILFVIARGLGTTRDRAFRLALLFAVLPAFNIYGAVSLDGVILPLMTLGLWGLVRFHRGRADCLSWTLLAGGVLGANLLTFGGVILAGIAGVVALERAVRARSFALLGALLAVIGAGLLLGWGLATWWGYDHLEAFRHASRLENPGGFLLLHDPREYLVTRVEDVAEILLFSSLGVLALLFRHGRLGLAGPVPGSTLAWCGIGMLLAAFLTGAFKTGETARACLFVYPYLLLAIRNATIHAWTTCLVLAALQTVAMQGVGSCFW
ncbi:MAG: hypothetical protein AB1726_06400 [Planctomycetota bacterium]